MESKSENRVQALKAHLALNVRNVETSLDFYRKLFGIEPSKVRTGYAKFDVHNPPLNLTLNQSSFNERGALSHLGIQVNSTADVLATRDRWVQVGLLTRDEMQTNCCYATQDKSWVRDPDGNEWEVFVVLQDNLPESAACECGDRVSPLTLAEGLGQRAIDGAVTTSPSPSQREEKLEKVVANSAATCCAPAPVGIGK